MKPLVYTKPNRFRHLAVITKTLVAAPLLAIGLAMVAYDVVTGHR